MILSSDATENTVLRINFCSDLQRKIAGKF